MLSFKNFLLFSVFFIQYAQRALFVNMEKTLNSENSIETDPVSVYIGPT
jgi:hypothetical protein